MRHVYEVGTTQGDAVAAARQWWIYLVVGLVVWGVVPRVTALFDVKALTRLCLLAE